MANSADPDQLASSEANWSGSTLFAKAGYIGSSWTRVKYFDTLIPYHFYSFDTLIPYHTCPKIEQVHVYNILMCKKKKCWLSDKQLCHQHSEASDQGLENLLRSVCPNTLDFSRGLSWLPIFLTIMKTFWKQYNKYNIP